MYVIPTWFVVACGCEGCPLPLSTVVAARLYNSLFKGSVNSFVGVPPSGKCGCAGRSDAELDGWFSKFCSGCCLEQTPNRSCIKVFAL